MMEVRPLGRQILADLYEYDPALLDDVDAIRGAMRSAAAGAGATILGDQLHHFSPQGVSGVVIIAESHLAIHTWPEHGYAALDLFTCGGSIDASACFASLVEALGCRRHLTTTVVRPVPTRSA
jgi:S-adenosylmethionine decarboxylase